MILRTWIGLAAWRKISGLPSWTITFVLRVLALAQHNVFARRPYDKTHTTRTIDSL